MATRGHLLSAVAALALAAGIASAETQVSATSGGIGFDVRAEGEATVALSGGEGTIVVDGVTVEIVRGEVIVDGETVADAPQDSLVFSEERDGLRLTVDGEVAWPLEPVRDSDLARIRLDEAEEALENGDGDEALRLAEESMELGDIDAPAFVGELLFQGDVVPRNLLRARMMFREATARGDSDGALFLGFMHHLGQGARLDYREAARYYREGAELGNEGAIRNLPILAAESDFEAVSYEEALEWLDELAALNNPDVEVIREKVEAARGGPVVVEDDPVIEAPDFPDEDDDSAEVQDDEPAQTNGRRVGRRGDSSKR